MEHDARNRAGAQRGEAHYRLGHALWQQNDLAGAEAAFREAADQRGGEYAYAHYSLGQLYQKAGRTEDAAKAFETFLQQAPGDGNRREVEQTLRELRRQAARGKGEKR